MLTVDHVFVLVTPGAPEFAALERLGCAVDRAVAHEGQGTANRCTAFRGGYLELLWIDDDAAAGGGAAARLQLRERARWRDTGASPFGIALRHAPDDVPGFPHWTYAPRYLPPSMPPIRVLDNPAGAAEPLLFALATDRVPGPGAGSLGDATVARWRVQHPALAAASPLRRVAVRGLEIATGPTPLLRIDFGGAAPDIDLRPDLPLLIAGRPPIMTP